MTKCDFQYLHSNFGSEFLWKNGSNAVGLFRFKYHYFLCLFYLSLGTGNQGDQIGRSFASWGIVYSGKAFENDESSPNFRTTCILGKSCALTLTKWVGRFFSQIHLVTLLAMSTMSVSTSRPFGEDFAKNRS
jgi:hypothetical protein